MHRDHLGSVVAVTNEAGTVVVRYSYDAWGKRRNPDGSDTVITSAEFDRGFTGHEMLDALGLVHMNGRVFDPNVGRFMSADFVVPTTELSVGFNRYAYVYNNPLSLTDPSGHRPFYRQRWFKQYGSSIAAIAISVFAPELIGAAFQYIGIAAGEGTLGAAVANAIAGGTAGFVRSGGDIKSSAQGALTAGMFTGAGDLGDGAAGFAAHAITGCVSASLQGGNRGRGAASQVVSKFVSINVESGKGFELQGFAAAVISGGTVSVITGGKFGNGAYTAAFGYLFNKIQHPQEEQLRHTTLVAADYIDGMQDECPECSAASFKKISWTISQTPRQGAEGTVALAQYDAATNTGTVFPGFFDANPITQATTLFHEYLHSMPENIALNVAGTDEQRQLPHDEQPWEAPVIRLEKIFLRRYGDQIWERRLQ